MNNIALIDLKNNPHSYTDLQCVVGAYFRPAILDQNTCEEIAEEIVSYCKPAYVKRVIRQIDIILDNEAINDERLATWVHRTSTSWHANTDTDARELLRDLQRELRRSVRSHQRARLLNPFEHGPSFA